MADSPLPDPTRRRGRSQIETFAPPLRLARLHPGLRVAVAVSGGADSVGLLRALAREQQRLGLVLSVAHVHHGIRGAEADADAAFVEAVAGQLALPFLRRDVDTPAEARARGTGLEETARRLRYGWFAELLAGAPVAGGGPGLDAVATAHTLGDQAETVLHRLLRGAWTEGLGGIHPVLRPPGTAGSGLILRPFLETTRDQITAWLEALGQPWREDATNADLAYTRNRIRHELLPALAAYNPRIAEQLAQVAELARDEEAYWEAEVARLLPSLLLPGRAVRGGGRASSTLPGERTLAIEVERLRGLAPALVRRLLRGAARELGVALDFDQTARLLALLDARPGANPRREDLTAELRAERTPRELRLLLTTKHARAEPASPTAATGVAIPVPGEGAGFGWRIRCSPTPGAGAAEALAAGPAILRAALASDRVQLRYSRGAPKRVKEVLERMGVPAADRGAWPLLTWAGEIVWMRGVVLETTDRARQLVVEATEAADAVKATGPTPPAEKTEDGCA